MCFWKSITWQARKRPIEIPGKYIRNTISAKSLWPPSDESPPPLPLFQCCYNDVDFSFDIFLNLQNNIGQGVWGKRKPLTNVIVWDCRCRNGLSDDFGPSFTKPRNYLHVSFCNATVAKGLMLCSQHIILALRMEFLPKEHQFNLLLTRTEKFLKCQEIPIISAGSKNTSVCSYHWRIPN